MKRVQIFANTIIENMEKVIVGKRDVIELLIVAMLCEGHILLEDVPGTGKTMMARSLAISLGLSFKRIQCTPDLLPNDITGVSIFNQQTREFEFRPGPIFVNILLADEINRATPRTQSALLEAMQEQQATADGVTYPLPRPFIVLATQNPIEYEGTFPLPEAQLDRFLMRIAVGYPSGSDEKKILRNLRYQHPIVELNPVEGFSIQGANSHLDLSNSAGLDAIRNKGVDLEYWQKLHHLVRDVHLDETLEDYIINLVTETREHPELALGGSPRASLALYKTAQAYAAIKGRDFVIPDDIKYLAPGVLGHRLIVRPEAQLRGRSVQVIVADILQSTALDIGTASNQPSIDAG